MVYGYNTNKEFIENAQILLDKLEKKGVWDKDTLVVALDKSVRPLAYTLRKLSKEEGKNTPDMRFFNYSSYDNILSNVSNKTYSSYLKKRVNPKKLPTYKDVVILDEYAFSGDSLRNSGKILEIYFSKSKNKPKIHFAALKKGESLRSELGHPQDLIYSGKDNKSSRLSESQTGIEDSTDMYKRFLRKKLPMVNSLRTRDEFNYSAFKSGRKKLSEDISQYIKERNGEESSPAEKSLEKAVQVVSLISFFGGIILSYKGITGNVIGSANSVNIFGIVLVILGLLGLVVTRRK